MLKTDFEWSPPVNIDGEFSLTGFQNATEGQYLEILRRELIPGTVAYGRVHHPEMPIFIRAPSNYIGIRGRAVSMFRWEPWQDAYIEQLEANFDTAPIPHRIIHEDISLDWDSRTLFRVSNIDMLPPTEWYLNTVEWGFDMPTRFEAMDGFGLVCMLSKDLYSWKDQIARLPAGASISMTRDPNASLTYLVPFGGSAEIVTDNGSVVLDHMEAAKFTQESATITAIEPLMFLWRSKIA